MLAVDDEKAGLDEIAHMLESNPRVAQVLTAVDAAEALRIGLVHEVLALLREDPDLARPLAHAPDHLRAEVVQAVRAEGALHLDDLLALQLNAAEAAFLPVEDRAELAELIVEGFEAAMAGDIAE